MMGVLIKGPGFGPAPGPVLKTGPHMPFTAGHLTWKTRPHSPAWKAVPHRL
jgi:hypothetical protein